MHFTISSETISNPPLVRILRHLTEALANAGYDFYVIGATARDLILQCLTHASVRRKTRDLDIAIAVPNWQHYREIQECLMDAGYEKSPHMAHRFLWKQYEIDVVPYGGVAKKDSNIYWPPEETTAMSVRGFEDVLRDAVTVWIDDEFKIRIASLHGLFILKLNAWIDRNLSTDKDAEDMWYIIDNYYMANESRHVHQEVYEMQDFNLISAGAYWLGHDIADLLNPEQIYFYVMVLKEQLNHQESSRLIMQILAAHRTVARMEVIQALTILYEVLNDRLPPF